MSKKCNHKNFEYIQSNLQPQIIGKRCLECYKVVEFKSLWLSKNGKEIWKVLKANNEY